MIPQLARIANRLDRDGLHQQADRIDVLLRKIAQEDLELAPPTPTEYKVTQVPWHQAVTPADMQAHIGNLSVGLTGTTPLVHDYLLLITFLLKHFYPGQTVYITSGRRSGRYQAQIMANNWKANGGSTPLKQPLPITYRGETAQVTTKGTLYFVNLYENTNMAYAFGRSLEEGEIDGQDPITYWGKYFDRRARGKGTHVSGNAIDFRASPIALQVIKDSQAYADIELIDETHTAAPHYHVSVHSVRKGTV